MTLNIYRLSFDAPLHLSKGRPNYDSSDELLHSDTLKSALFVAARQILRGWQDIDLFNAFHVSSAMPFWGEEHFFLRPSAGCVPFLFKDKGNSKDDPRQEKAIKKIRFVGQSIYEKMLAGNSHNVLELTANHCIQDKTMVSNHPSIASEVAVKGLDKREIGERLVYKADVTQRVHIYNPNDPDKPQDESSVPFFLDKLYFDNQAGLYFIVQTNDKLPLSMFDQIVNHLGESGIGLQRLLGNGQFKAKRETLDVALPSDSNAITNISLYCPNNETELKGLLTDNCSYNLINRSGWISTPEKEENLTLRKKSVYMFAEGSVFGKAATTLETIGNGQLVLTPQYEGVNPVWRDGKGMFLPIKI
jgi:CRISPR-associated protein Csm4